VCLHALPYQLPDLMIVKNLDRSDRSEDQNLLPSQAAEQGLSDYVYWIITNV
jgi:hypothetical protein